MCAIAGTVDVWRVDLSRTTGEGLTELLCAQERERAGRIVDARRRASWTRSRGVLRALLARYLDADPRELRFVTGVHGKPGLGSGSPETRRNDGPEPRPGSGSGASLRFNLSHSRELMLLAVTAGREVGVDVECARERCTAEFLRAWTLREATGKCLGTGLTRGFVTAGEQTQSRPWTAGLDVGSGATAAVAVEGRGACELRLRDAPPKLMT